MSGISGHVVKYIGISRVIGIFRPFPWRTFGWEYWVNRRRVPCTWTCNSLHQYPVFQDGFLPFVLILLWQLLLHQGNQIAYPYLFPWLYFQYAPAGMQIHAGIEIRCGNVFKLFPCTNFMNEGNQFHAEIFRQSGSRSCSRCGCSFSFPAGCLYGSACLLRSVGFLRPVHIWSGCP